MKISIILPTYNRSAFLKNTIDSILAQTFKNWELVVIDDGSTDNTKKIVSSFLADKRIKYIYQKNQERSAARNNGIKKANGDFICFVDSDEKLNSNHLEQISNGIKKHNYEAAVYNYDIGFVFPNKENNYTRKGMEFTYPVKPNELISVIIGVPQLCIAKEILDNYRFDPMIKVGEDTELLFRISEKFPIYYIEGGPTIFEIEHENRSVNRRSISAELQLITLKKMFSKNHPANNVSKSLKRKLISEVYFNASIDYLNEKKMKGLKSLFISIISDFRSKKTKFKIFLFLQFFMKNKSNYKNYLKNE